MLLERTCLPTVVWQQLAGQPVEGMWESLVKGCVLRFLPGSQATIVTDGSEIRQLPWSCQGILLLKHCQNIRNEENGEKPNASTFQSLS